MKYLLVIALVALLVVLFFRRLRPYFRLVQEFFKSLRQIQRILAGGAQSRNQVHEAEKLVRCENCGTWVPGSRVVTANSVQYCSRDCLEKAAIANRRTKSQAR